MNTWNSTFKTPGKPLARKAPLRRTSHKAALKSGEKKLRQRVILDEKPVFRSPEYLAAVRTLNCVCCGRWRWYTQAAHSNQLRFSKAKGQKASDATSMALCCSTPDFPGCHNRLDQGGMMTKEERNQFEYKHICLTVAALVRSGKLTGSTMTLLVATPSVCHDYENLAVLLVSLIESGELKVVKEAV
jgi:hypothetical protein